MKNLVRASQLSKPNYLHKLLTTEFDDISTASELFNEFFRHTTYSQNFCLRLLALAGRSAGLAWDIRRVAVLMLEHQILKLSPGSLDEFDLLLTQLKLKPALGVNVKLANSVLKEGYSTTNLRRFIPEFRRKLERLNRVHVGIKGRRSSELALSDFIKLSRRDCKLSLARYIFQPDEVCARILAQLQISEGVKDTGASGSSNVEHELRRVLSALPDYEAGILKKLCETSNIYWATEATSSEINSLVEYPLTTVVLVVKPPGSDLEFEFKRAGLKGAKRLSVVYARDGHPVPPSHRLDGGSMLGLLRYEANAALRFANIYRLAHGTEAPMSSYLTRTNIYTVPTRKSEASVISYFTEPRIFGQGFREMRAAMKESVAAFEQEDGSNLNGLQGDLGLTAQFISQVLPAQSILTGTSSFRLDKLALYLSPQGAEIYFTEGLHAARSKHDEKGLADEILEEVLGIYYPPQVRYRSYQQYLEAAFAVTENRAQADQAYLSVMQQIGNFWGTLLAVRGYARGESFVARNVGLKSCWNEGRWSVKIIFMDHDALVIPDAQAKLFYPHGDIPCMRKDERFIWGETDPRQFAISEVGYLQKIYRTGDDLNARGRATAYKALKEGYRKTQDGLLTNPKLKKLFHKLFVERLTDWDAFVSGYLQVRHNPSAVAVWKRAMKKKLDGKGYKRGATDSLIGIVQKNLDFIETYSFLFNSDTSA